MCQLLDKCHYRRFLLARSLFAKDMMKSARVLRIEFSDGFFNPVQLMSDVYEVPWYNVVFCQRRSIVWWLP